MRTKTPTKRRRTRTAQGDAPDRYTARIQKVIDQLAATVVALDAKDPLFHSALKAGPPASTAAVAALEKRLGVPLPSSYRAFLALHDGFRGIAVTASLLPIAKVATPRKSVSEWKRRENKPQAIVIGERENQSDLVYLDPTRPTKNGELAVVEWDHEDDERTYPDLLSYLRECLVAGKRWLADVPQLVARDARADRAREVERAAKTAEVARRAKAARAPSPLRRGKRDLAKLDDGDVNRLAFSPDGALLVASTGYGSPRVWDVRQGVLVRTIEVPESVASVAMGAVIAIGHETSIGIYSLEGQLLARRERAAYSNAAVDPHGMRVVATDSGNSLVVWEGPTWKRRVLAKRLGGDPRDIVWTKDFLAFFENDTGRIQLWDPKDLRPHRIIDTSDPVTILAAGAGRLASGHGNTARLWNPTTGEQRWTVPTAPWMQSMAISDKVLVTSASGQIRTWDRAGKLLKTHRGSARNVALALSHGVLAEGGAGITLRNV